MEFRSVVKAGRKHKFRVSHVTFDYNRDGAFTRDISFGGVTFPITVPVTADLNWDLWRFGYEYDFVAGDRGLLGTHHRAQAESPDGRLELHRTSVHRATDVTAPIINLGVIVRVYPHRIFSITAEYTGFKVFGL